MNRIRVVKVSPLQEAYTLEGFINTPEAIKEFLGDEFEIRSYFLDGSIFVCQKGSTKSSTPNRAIRDKKGNIKDIICGNFIIAWKSGYKEGNICSIPEHYAEKYKNMFLKPEVFRKTPKGEILMVKVDS